MPIVYLDEVGRGTAFGNVVVAAVIWSDNSKVKEELPFKVKSFDSKKLSPKKRKILSEYIKRNAVAYAIAEETPQVIDEINILRATQKAFHKALDQLDGLFDEIYVDGNCFNPYFSIKNDDFISSKCIIKGDDTFKEIGFASILAKVKHDEDIIKMCDEHPELDTKYNLRKCMGYLTKAHINGIKDHGYSEFHRKSFKIKRLMN